MDTTLRLESQRLAQELHQLIETLEPASWRADLTEIAQQHLLRVRARCRALLAALDRQRSDRTNPAFVEALRSLGDMVDDFASRVATAPNGARQLWRAAFRRLQPAYANLLQRLGSDADALPEMRPTNYRRTLFHVTSALGAAALVLYVFTRTETIWAAVSFATFAWTTEGLRRIWPRYNTLMLRVFGPIVHPHEWRRITSATWYGTSVLLLAVLFPLQTSVVGLVVLGLADPAAGAIGRRWGQTPIVAHRSLEGTLTFFVVACAAAWAMLAAYHPTLSLTEDLAIAGFAGLAGALAELWSRRVDDNFSIPLAVAAATQLGILLVT